MTASINDSLKMDSEDKIQEKSTGSSTTFTISFEDEDKNINAIKQRKIIKTANMYTKRHYRTLSLPNAGGMVEEKDSENYNNCGNPINDSSQEMIEENGSKVNEEQRLKKDPEKAPVSNSCNDDTERKSTDNHLNDTDSEGGTYTIDKNNEHVNRARKSIDQVFGIVSENESQQLSPEKKSRKKVDEWMESSISMSHSTPNVSDAVKSKAARLSKIPFAVEKLKETSSSFTISTNGIAKNSNQKFRPRTPDIPKKINQLDAKKPKNDENDTTQFLRETESIVTAIQKRIHTNIKAETKSETMESELKGRSNGQEKETAANKFSNTRFNRAFSLRRDRLKKSVTTVSNTNVPVRSKTFIGTSSVKSISNELSSSFSKGIHNIKQNTSFGRDIFKNGHNSQKQKSTPQRPKGGSNSSKNNCSMSPQEIELINWKRRKNYDPLKAVAEEKKKKAMALSAAGNGSGSESPASSLSKKEAANCYDTKDLSTKIITRSASFHGLRNKSVHEQSEYAETSQMNRSTADRSVSSYSMSFYDEPEDYDYDNEDNWSIPKPPSTSLQNTPPESISSRLSLLSNAASNSSIVMLSSSLTSKVDPMTVSMVTQLSYKIKDVIFSLADPPNTPVEELSENYASLKNKTDPSCRQISKENGIGHNSYTENNINIEETEFKDLDGKHGMSEISPEHQLNITLSNLQQIYEAVQRLQLCP